MSLVSVQGQFPQGKGRWMEIQYEVGSRRKEDTLQQRLPQRKTLLCNVAYAGGMKATYATQVPATYMLPPAGRS